MFCTKSSGWTGHLYQVLELRKDGANRWQTQQITAECSKPSACWARRGQSWAQHIVTEDENEKHEEDDDDEDEEELRQRGGGRVRGGRGRAQVRRGKNPRPGESLDKDKRRDRQYNYEQARSTRHTGRLADFLLNSPQIFDTVFSWTSHPQPPAEPFLHIFHHPVTANIDAERSLTAATCQHCSFKTGDLVVVNLRHPREHWAAGLLPALSWPCGPGSRLPAVVVVDR